MGMFSPDENGWVREEELNSLRAVVAQVRGAMASCDDSGYWDGYTKIRSILSDQPKVLAVVDAFANPKDLIGTLSETQWADDDPVTAIIIERSGE